MKLGQEEQLLKHLKVGRQGSFVVRNANDTLLHQHFYRVPPRVPVVNEANNSDSPDTAQSPYVFVESAVLHTLPAGRGTIAVGRMAHPRRRNPRGIAHITLP